MDQPDHMIDMVIILSVNFCPCKIRYQVNNLWDQRKGTKEGLWTLKFIWLKKKNFIVFFYSYKNLRVERPSLVPFLWSHKFLTWCLILHGQIFTDKIITISIIHCKEFLS